MWIYATLGFTYFSSVTMTVVFPVIFIIISTHCQPVFGILRNKLIPGTAVAALPAAKYRCNKAFQARLKLPDGVVETIVLVSIRSISTCS